VKVLVVVGGAVERFLDVRDRSVGFTILVEHEPQEVQGVGVGRMLADNFPVHDEGRGGD